MAFIISRINRTPIYMACISGYFPVVELLLTEGADPNIFDIHDFYFSSSYFHTSFLKNYVYYIRLIGRLYIELLYGHIFR